jgi:hypothetical protein
VSLRCSPFKALYGYDASMIWARSVKGDEDVAARDVVQQIIVHSSMLKEHLTKAQQRLKHYADMRRLPGNFRLEKRCCSSYNLRTTVCG